MIRKALVIALLIYSVASTYMIVGYEKMNDKLQRVTDTLLATCTNSKIGPVEGERYK
jgi:hypothetical protein